VTLFQCILLRDITVALIFFRREEKFDLTSKLAIYEQKCRLSNGQTDRLASPYTCVLNYLVVEFNCPRAWPYLTQTWRFDRPHNAELPHGTQCNCHLKHHINTQLYRRILCALYIYELLNYINSYALNK
jgi:hypothetical protein